MGYWHTRSLDRWVGNAIILSNRPPICEKPGCEFTCKDSVYLTKASVAEDLSALHSIYLNGNRELVSVGFQLRSELEKSEPTCLVSVHQTCFDIAKRVMAVALETGAEAESVTSLKTLHEVFLVRMSRKESWFKSDPWWSFHILTDRWYVNTNWGRSMECNISEANPSSFPDTTDFILSLLRPLPPPSLNNPSLAHTSLKSSIENLPAELGYQVTDSLMPLKNPPLQCTRVLPQAYWTQALVSGKLLPWLWDLDLKKLEELLAPGSDIPDWDVERLVRQLSQQGFGDYYIDCLLSSGDTIPYGLCNRYRIWREVKEMRVGG